MADWIIGAILLFIAFGLGIQAESANTPRPHLTRECKEALEYADDEVLQDVISTELMYKEKKKGCINSYKE